jgi:hypothetical protein
MTFEHLIKLGLRLIDQAGATEPKVAALMITDHTAILNELQRLAKKKHPDGSNANRDKMPAIAPIQSLKAVTLVKHGHQEY